MLKSKKSKSKNKGFTLVELLVVMAIIAILASIVVPNLATWIGRGRVTKAVSEIESIELALSAMLADTERSSLNDLFVYNGMKNVLDTTRPAFDTYITSIFGVSYDPTNETHRMEIAKKIYTNTSYALLIAGRGALENNGATPPVGMNKGFDNELAFSYLDVVDNNAVKRLGTNYLPDIQFDPWGKLYNIFPGPWKNGPNIFRRYLDVAGTTGLPGTSATGSGSDNITLNDAQVVDPETGASEPVGFEANRRKPFYIWSNGANTVSGQAIYDTTGAYSAPGVDETINYLPQETHQMGGGDDINNWDSGSTWGRFYN